MDDNPRPQQPPVMPSTSPACHAVLGTYELLERIIACVPPDSMQKLKRISKAWLRIFERSRTIQHAAVLRPVGTKIPSNSSLGPSVLYHSSAMKVHPLAPKVWKFEEGKFIGFHFASLGSVSSTDFATSPPCTAIQLNMRFCVEHLSTGQSVRRGVRSTVFNPSGTVLQDLEDVRNAVLTQMENRYNVLSVRSWAVVARE